MIVKFYISVNTESKNKMFNIMKLWFEYYNFKIDIELNTKEMMKSSRGHTNPATGFVVILYDTICFDMYDVIDVLNRKGMVQI